MRSSTLFVVGGGVSGLSAAYFFRQRQPNARILILDNHDDFGGHAKRNEFMVNGRRIIGYGGSQSMEAPSAYSAVAKRLLRDLTVDVDAFDHAYDHDFYQRHGLTSGIFFDAEHFGQDRWLPWVPFDSGMVGFTQSALTPEQAVAQMPLTEPARKQLLDLLTVADDRLPDVSLTQLADRLGRVSYEQFLTEHVGITEPQILQLLRRSITGYFGLGTDATNALEAMLFGLPGINKLGVPGAKWMVRQAIEWAVEPYIHHFPDGNATIARLLARSLVPQLSPARAADASVQALFDYGRLDDAANAVRIRLSSTALRVANRRKGGVEVLYRQHGQTSRVRAKHSVLACYNMMIPHLCPELPAAQRRALSQLVKVPLVYTNVVLNNWRAVKQQGMGFAYTPNAFHAYCMVDFPISMGGYQFAQSPDDPIVLHFSEALIEPGLPPRDQHRVGRARLLATPFRAIERDVRQTLAGILGPGGFDPAADIAAITVNRWPHGYAYAHNPLFDPDYAQGQAPHEVGRARFGNIAIANSDAGGRAYLDEAIDQAHRAVDELIGG